jgi:hypothetical protein
MAERMTIGHNLVHYERSKKMIDRNCDMLPLIIDA